MTLLALLSCHPCRGDREIRFNSLLGLSDTPMEQNFGDTPIKADFIHGSFISKLKELGPDVVRERLSEGYWTWPAEECAKEWLEYEDNKLRLIFEARAEEREIDTLEIAKEANLIDRSASRWAMWAAIIAVIAAAIAIKDQIVALIFVNS